MKLKPGVIIDGVRPEIVIGLMCAQKVYDDMGVTLVVTSMKDGKHSANSFHYKGLAADLRTRNLDDPHMVVRALRMALPTHFDVVLEKDHIHLEYDNRS